MLWIREILDWRVYAEARQLPSSTRAAVLSWTNPSPNLHPVSLLKSVGIHLKLARQVGGRGKERRGGGGGFFVKHGGKSCSGLYSLLHMHTQKKRCLSEITL